MAPEQARGRPVDRRADVWALGAVLFEMLTARRAVTGDDEAAITAGRPCLDPKWSLLPPARPQAPAPLLLPRPEEALWLDAARAPGWRSRTRSPARPASRDVGPATRPGAGAPGVGALPRLLARWHSLPPCASGRPGAGHLLPETRTDIVTAATDDPCVVCAVAGWPAIVFCGLRRWHAAAVAAVAWSDSRTAAGRHRRRAQPVLVAGQPVHRLLHRYRAEALDLGGGAPHAVAPASSGTGGTWTADGFIVFAPSPSSPLMRVPSTGGAAAAGDHVRPAADRAPLAVRAAGRQAVPLLCRRPSRYRRHLRRARSTGAPPRA